VTTAICNGREISKKETIRKQISQEPVRTEEEVKTKRKKMTTNDYLNRTLKKYQAPQIPIKKI